MTQDSGHQKPTNAIVVSGTPITQVMKVTVVASMYAGRLVMKGTNDDDAIVNTGEGTAIGWLGYEQTHKNYRPATVDTIYVGVDSSPSVATQAAILSGPGMIIVGSLAVSQTIVKGDMLVATTAGQLIKWTVGHTPVAIAEESITTTSQVAQDIMVRSLI
jgi:hypothetical protein